ncbi:MAG TPA: hypothetical protein VKF41_05610 [Bryobacteraceae bacterium]|nr:hypothetical protein [Bryobacteraceae bacterium]
MSRSRKREPLHREPLKESGAPPPPQDRLTAFLERRSRVLVLALILLASLRIVTTYKVFNHMVDEPGHIAAGMEWLEKGVYQWEAQHPPLARVVSALGPYLLGIRSQGTPHQGLVSLWHEGTRILYYGHNYDHTLAMARLGMLPFFWIACLAVYWWGSLHFSRAAGVVAVFLFSFIPPVLAHAGITTTDMALTAFLGAAFVAGLAWVEKPSPARAVWFGIAAGLMALSKFSCLAFFPAAAVLALAGYFVSQRPKAAALAQAAKARVPTLALAVAVSLVAIWAGYRFSFGSVSPGGMPVPAPEFFRGIQAVQTHLDSGHDGYLLGETRRTGFWDFYLVAIAFKTPLGFLALLGIGAVLAFGEYPLARRLWLPLGFSLGVLLVGMFSTINIGLRHVLPVYTGFSLVAAVAVLQLWDAGRTRKWKWAVLGGLSLWFAGSSLLSHPDYLAYFNELAGSEPENILVDSDLDWGQDLKRLSKRLHEVGATSVAYTGFDYADLEGEHGFPPVHGMSKLAPIEGWNAIGVTSWKELRVVTWPDQIKPQERVGKSILLWYFPPAKH